MLFIEAYCYKYWLHTFSEYYPSNVMSFSLKTMSVSLKTIHYIAVTLAGWWHGMWRVCFHYSFQLRPTHSFLQSELQNTAPVPCEQILNLTEQTGHGID